MSAELVVEWQRKSLVAVDIFPACPGALKHCEGSRKVAVQIS